MNKLRHATIMITIGVMVLSSALNISVATTVPQHELLEDNIVTTIEAVILEADDPTTQYRHSNDENNYLNITFDGSRLKVEGKTVHTEKNHLWLQVRRPGSNNKVKDAHFTMNGDGSYSYETNLSLSKGTYEIHIFHNDQRYNQFESFYHGIRFEKTSKEGYRFVLSPYYQEAIEFIRNLEPVSPQDTNYAWYSQEEQNGFRETLNTLIDAEMTDYEKMIAISTWVSENIHYNYDALYKRLNPNPSNSNVSGTYAYMALYGRRSVCQGYAELSNVLFRMAGIPSRVISGQTVYNVERDTFWDVPASTPEQAPSSHAWNVVFVDGRWRYIDTTWNSSNRYEYAEFEKAPATIRYLDQTLASFSNTHRSLRAKPN